MTKCFLCQSAADDKYQYGEILHKKDVYVHKNCLYVTTALTQEGSDNEGILGFLLKTIRAKTEMLKKYRCFFCKQKYANVVCCYPKCQRRYHTVCGIDNNVQFEYCKQFRSFCTRHLRPVRFRPENNVLCYICYDKLRDPGEPFNSVSMLGAPCCRNGWFHKLCLQKYAISAGYFFKCPLCNDSERFRNHMSYRGIFIPDQDAAWEMEPNAFRELVEQQRSCVAEICQNQRGRESHCDDNPFISCQTCGACVIHTQCLGSSCDNFNCKDCLLYITNNNSLQEEYADIESDSFIDIETVDDNEQQTMADNFQAKKEIANIAENEINAESSDSENELNVIAKHLHLRKNKSRKRVILDSPINIQSSDENEVLLIRRKRRRVLCAARDTSPDSEPLKKIMLSSKLNDNHNTHINNETPNKKYSKKPTNSELERSCIAKRTRRNSSYNTAVSVIQFQPNKNRYAMLNSSCIANRTRRRLSTSS